MVQEIIHTQTACTIDRSEIVTILNAPTLNLLPSLNLKNVAVEKDPITEKAAISIGDGTLYIQDYDQDKDYLKPSVFKVIDFLIMEIGKQNEYKLDEDEVVDTKIFFSIKEFGEILGKKNLESPSTKKEIRRIIDESLSLLNDFSISTTEKRKGKFVEFSEMKMLDSFKCDNSVYIAKLNEEFTRYVLSSYVMNFPMALFGLDMRNRNIYSLGKKMSYHQSNNKNIRKKTSEIIGIETLLKNCPDLPTIDEVRQKNGGWRSRIADKLESVLDKLVDYRILESWEFCNSKGTALTDEQIDMKSYFEFIKLRIKFKVRGFES